MKRRLTAGHVVLAAFLLLVLLGAAALLAPLFEATPFREPLRAELSRALGREVTFRDVRYSLWPRPGLLALELVIPDDPAFGLEPFAYVSELHVGIRWRSLLSRRLEIASASMSGASVNLARQDGLGWNAGRLLQHFADSVRTAGYAPALALRDARVNFRQGTLKSAFFLNNVVLDLDPPSRPSGGFQWSFEASPARTDRAEQGFGRFTGQGLSRPGAGRDGEIEVEMELDRSILSEVATLLAGRDLGLQGRLSSRVRLDGPLHEIRLRGRLDLEGLDRSGMFGARGREWSLPYEGVLDLTRQSLEFRTLPPREPGAEPPPLSLRLVAESVLTSPKWEAAVAFDSIPAGDLLDLAWRLGARVPPGLDVRGTLTGSLAIPRDGQLSGEVELRDAIVRLGSAGPVTIPAAALRLAADAVAFDPAEIHTPDGNIAELAGNWSAATEALSFTLRLDAMPLNDFRTAADAIPGAPPVPLLSRCAQGTLSGTLRFQRATETAPAPWSGELALAGVQCPVEGAAAPVILQRATFTLKGADWSARRATVQCGPLEFEAAADYRAAAIRPLRLSLTFAELHTAAVETLLRPTLARRRGFLDRTFRRPTPVPAWLALRRLEASVRAASATLAGEPIQNLAVRLYWDGPHIEIPSLSLRHNGASLSGRLALRLDTAAPAYHLLARLDDFPWQDAYLETDLDLHASGLGDTLLDSLRASGAFRLRGLAFDDEPMRHAAGCYDYDARRPPAARLRLRCLELQVGGDLLTGAATTSDQRLTLEFASPRRTLRLQGPVWPLALDTVR